MVFLPNFHIEEVKTNKKGLCFLMLFFLLVGVFDVVIAGVHTGVSYCVEQAVMAMMDGIYKIVRAIK